MKIDVLVVGGGMAGIAAAISSARLGASTCLIDRSDVFGGNATQAFVHTFCGLFLLQPGPDYTYANPGFAERFPRWLIAQGAAWPPETHGKVGVLPIRPRESAGLIRQACAAVPRLQIIHSASLTSLTQPDTNRFAGTFASAGETVSFETSFVIDTSGGAHAAAALGAETDTPSSEELQHPTFIFRVSGANPEDAHGFQRLKLVAAISRAARKGELPAACDSVFVRPAGEPGEAFISLNMPKPEGEVYNPLDPACLRRIEETARERAGALITYLRTHAPGWQACQLLEWPRSLGVRETRRVKGLYRMTVDDILEGRTFEDAIAVSTWPVELWNQHTGATFRYPVAPCQIPLRALISCSHSRLGMAGRCMSGTHEALGALRVLGTAMATGEAIGLASALAARKLCSLEGITAEEVRSARKSVNQEAGEQP